MGKSTIDVRPAAERFHTKIDWLDSWHSFSFGDFYDPGNSHHGLLRVLNDDVIAAGRRLPREYQGAVERGYPHHADVGGKRRDDDRRQRRSAGLGWRKNGEWHVACRAVAAEIASVETDDRRAHGEE